MEIQMKVTIGLALVNIVLLLFILGLNVSSYKRMRAEYTLFSMIFAALFLLQYVAGAWFYFTNMSLYPVEIATHMLVITGLQTGAFGYMLWMLRQ